MCTVGQGRCCLMRAGSARSRGSCKFPGSNGPRRTTVRSPRHPTLDKSDRGQDTAVLAYGSSQIGCPVAHLRVVHRDHRCREPVCRQDLSVERTRARAKFRQASCPIRLITKERTDCRGFSCTQYCPCRPCAAVMNSGCYPWKEPVVRRA